MLFPCGVSHNCISSVLSAARRPLVVACKNGLAIVSADVSLLQPVAQGGHAGGLRVPTCLNTESLTHVS